MRFTQHIVIYADDSSALADLLHDWNADEAAKAPGYLGGRLLGFRDKPGRYVLQADFASWEDAQKNNERPETQKWSEALMGLITGEPKYENLDVIVSFDA